ncbi:hypothetical protein [Candidatus Phytoplasma solani]|uniref:hypothetical protein n=1 Tax=Candidatus Phytoplasma solani TaxID=69896 RepID=UPI00358F1267
MELFNVNGVSVYDSDGARPGYNSHTYKQVGSWYFKNPPKGLLGVYFKPRINPFNSKHPHEDYKYTLDDLLKYETAIEEAFVFWDANVITPTNPPKIHLLQQNIYVGQSKEEAINKYLISNQITNHTKVINPYCYNTTPTTGLVLPLPSKNFHEIDIDAIYFDAGIRIMPENTPNKTYTINDLLKLSNGAKNIYLFAFNTKKYIKTITLPDNIDPYTAIRDWKRVNNLYAYEGEYNRHSKSINSSIKITTPNNYHEINISFTVNLLENTFETEDKIYYITCQDIQPKQTILKDYHKDYITWLNQCYIKNGAYYTGGQVRKMIGRSSKTLYDENGNTHFYKYTPGSWVDEWYIDGKSIGYSFSNEETQKQYHNFLDTSSPPKKPDILDN